MYEKLDEFDEFSGHDQDEYLNKFQDDLENEDNDKSASNDVPFLGTALSAQRYEQMQKNALQRGDTVAAKRYEEKKIDAMVEEQTKDLKKSMNG